MSKAFIHGVRRMRSEVEIDDSFFYLLTVSNSRVGRRECMATIGSLIDARPVFTVQQSVNVLEAVKYMAEKNVGAVAVLDGSRLVGIFSERDVLVRVLSKNLDPQRTPIVQVMTKNLIVAEKDEDEESCLRKMKSANCRHLPVVSGDTLIGMISLRDLLQVELTERDEKLQYLTSYLFHVPPGSGGPSGS